VSDPPVDDPAVAALAEELGRARKYAGLSPQALRRIAVWALQRASSEREAAKLARRKLHQAYAAYLPAAGLREAERATAALGREDLETVCRAVLACHSSTRERLPYMRELFAAAFDGLTGAVRVADLACGLTPFAIPWMPLGGGAVYEAIDFDVRTERLVTALAEHVEVGVRASTVDLVSAPPTVKADVVLVLKAIPTLEQQQQGAGARLLERIEARRIAISVSAHSLCGRLKGMRSHHDEQLRRMLPERMASARRLDFPSETLFLLDG
jgi:16S rRNA (guanine(1405)-N(7))-methyltransferase